VRFRNKNNSSVASKNGNMDHNFGFTDSFVEVLATKYLSKGAFAMCLDKVAGLKFSLNGSLLIAERIAKPIFIPKVTEKVVAFKNLAILHNKCLPQKPGREYH
jgi:hypothetical protein